MYFIYAQILRINVKIYIRFWLQFLFSLMTLRVNNYTVIQKLGHGGFSEIFAVEKRVRGKKEIFAMKAEAIEADKKGLEMELKILKCLPNDKYFTKVLDTGKTGTLNYFVMPLYGPSLSTLKSKLSSKRMSTSTAIRVGIITLDIIHRLHRRRVIHCDIKPSNFLLQNKIYGGFVLIDYGLSYRYKGSFGKHISNGITAFKGTLRYASVNVHRNNLPSRRDDVISWFYILVEMIRGNLPWDDITDKNICFSYKQSLTPERLCNGTPSQLVDVWKIIKDLKFEEKPPYSKIESLLMDIVQEKNWHLTDIYDWERENIIKYCTDFPEYFDTVIQVNNIDSSVCCII